MYGYQVPAYVEKDNFWYKDVNSKRVLDISLEKIIFLTSKSSGYHWVTFKIEK